MVSELRISTPGDLIAAVPAVLGFTPEQSLVVIALKRPTETGTLEIATTVRADLPQYRTHSECPAISQVANVCRRSEIVAAFAIVVDDRVSPPVGDGVRPHRDHHQLIADLDKRLTELDVVLVNAWAVAEFCATALWWTLVRPYRRGTLPDPRASRTAMLRVFDGCPLYRSRADLEHLVAVDESLRDQVARALPPAAADAHRRFLRAVRIGNPDAYSRMALWRVIEAIKQATDFSTCPPSVLAETAVALRDPQVRDCMFGVTAGIYMRAAEQVWLTLTRSLSGPDRAEAAMLLAFNAYRRGDGALAGVALEVALAADPGHRMALLLDTALQSAMHPDRLQKLIQCGVEEAADLRVDIGVTQPDPSMSVTK
ncbi:MAG: hypothetical protein JWN03_3224 [Nocardia sp.]|uniref:DUF4192 domain-containing protein n=1 Tax=Nocardia sp. TaxID=1821 RepID=UPI00262B7AD7|nr:DUF4192 domain-containing protein [Nocardia sp.]MCU1642949.1 hypothetical protein [Nocardia sp.]